MKNMFDFLKSKSELLAKYEDKVAYYDGKVKAMERKKFTGFWFDAYIDNCGKLSLYNSKVLRLKKEIDDENTFKALKIATKMGVLNDKQDKSC
jgi:hypothetical protein